MFLLRRAPLTVFALIAAQAAVAAVFQALNPRYGGLASLPAHTARLTGVFILLALCVLAAALAFALLRRPAWLENPRSRKAIALSAPILLLGAPLLLAALEAVTADARWVAYANYALSLAPPLLILGLTGLELCALSLWRRRETFALWLAGHRRLPLILALTALFFLAVFVSRAGVRDLDNLFYGHPGVPVFEWQILLAVCAGLGLAYLAMRKSAASDQRLDRWLFLAIWAGTALLWLSRPLVPGGYALAPQAPNYEVYPFSDAMNYDVYAQTLLTGAGFNAQIPPRPLYVTILAGFHAIAGQETTAVIALQSLLLALFPALLYLLAAQWAGRPAGLALALLAALRDLNTNAAAPFATNISYSKLFLSELPTALLLVLFALFLTRWSARGMRDLWQPLAAGGLAGLATLTRTQSLIVLPAAFALLFLAARASGGLRRWLYGFFLASLAALVTLVPWLWRNFQITGGLVFDDPVTQTMVLAQRYGSVYFSQPIPQETGETTAAYTRRLMDFALDHLRRDPRRILSAAVSHWVNNLAGSLRVVPLRAAIRAPGDFFNPAWAFWETRLESFGPGLVVLLSFTLFVACAGCAGAFATLGWAGLLPLAINFSYNLWSALFLTSGERFLLPVDWAFLLYFCAGLFALLAPLFPRLRIETGVQPLPEPPVVPHRSHAPAVVLALLGGFLLAGASIPLAERLIPPRFPSASQAELLARLTTAGQDAGLSASPQVTLLQGRAVHPLYFPAGGGIAGVEDLGYRPSPQARLVFHIAGPQSTLAVLPISAAPDFFPNGADIVAAGQFQGGLFSIRTVSVEKDGRAWLWMASP